MCPVFLDVELRGAAKAAQTAANEISQVFSRLGMGINRDLDKAIGKGFAALDTTAARAELVKLQDQARAAASIQEDASRRMVSSAA
jgi:hypothetical protein